jgi:competence protein ComEA
VHVAGAVHNPGVYTLAPDARSQQAIEAAGGLLPDAYATGLNLAAHLADGQLLYVPRVGETPPPSSSDESTHTTVPTSDNPLDLNTATAEQLDALPCLGSTLAERIVAYRQVNGKFRSVDELDQVEGIGPGCLEKIRSQLFVQ